MSVVFSRAPPQNALCPGAVSHAATAFIVRLFYRPHYASCPFVFLFFFSVCLSVCLSVRAFHPTTKSAKNKINVNISQGTGNWFASFSFNVVGRGHRRSKNFFVNIVLRNDGLCCDLIYYKRLTRLAAGPTVACHISTWRSDWRRTVLLDTSPCPKISDTPSFNHT